MVAAALWYPYKALPARAGHGLVRHVVRRLRGPGQAGHRGPDARRHRGAPRSRPRIPGGPARCPTSSASPPPGGYADAWSFTAPIIDMPVYLRWLRDRLAALGGTVTRMCAGGAAADRRRGGQLRRARLAAAGRRPRRAPGAGAGGAARRRRRWIAGGSTGRSDVRRPAQRHGRRRRHRRGRGLEPDPVPRDRGRRSCAARPAWSRRSPRARVVGPPGRPAARAPRRPSGGGGSGDPLLRPRRCGRHGQLGLCRRSGGPGGRAARERRRFSTARETPASAGIPLGREHSSRVEYRAHPEGAGRCHLEESGESGRTVRERPPSTAPSA